MTRRIKSGVVISLAAVLICSCGGTTEGAFEPVGGGAAPGSGGMAGTAGAGQGGSGGSAGAVTDGGGGAPFNPGAITLPGSPGSPAAFDAGGLLDAYVPPVPVADAGATVSAPPTAAVIYGCAELCAKEATVTCPAQQTLADCRAGCSLALANPKCTQTTQALFTCSKTATATCGSDGKATLKGCEAQSLMAGGCFLTNAADPAMNSPCASFCGKVATAKCPNDGTVADCIGGCTIMGNLLAGCGPTWNAYVTCANGATAMACGNDGKAWAPACVGQAFTFLGCAASLYQTVTADAGP